MFEGVRIALSYLGEPHSPAYVQGISGAAFRVGGICPCAPTCDIAMEPQDLIALLGYEATYMPLHNQHDAGLDEALDSAIARVKEEVGAGRPALVWHAFTNCEWDVVAGYDDEGHLFLGRGSYVGFNGYARADQRRTITCLDTCPALGVMVIGNNTGAFDARRAEIDALYEAVRHAHSTEGQDQLAGDEWVMLHGLLCYDRWIDDWRSPRRKRTLGDSYCLGVYRSTHRAAAGFMQELAPKYPRARAHLERAAESFAVEAGALDAAVPLLWWNASEGPDPKRNARLVPLLQQARDAYARGIEEIDGALGAIG
jgi:hypothetical protein